MRFKGGKWFPRYTARKQKKFHILNQAKVLNHRASCFFNEGGDTTVNVAKPHIQCLRALSSC